MRELASTTAWNGTLIVNIGPTADGLIPMIFQERLASLGVWLKANGEAIFGTRPWKGAVPSAREDGKGAADGYYTSKGAAVYFILLAWPTATGELELQKAPAAYRAELVPTGEPLKQEAAPAGGLKLTLGKTPPYGAPEGGWAIRLTPPPPSN